MGFFIVILIGFILIIVCATTENIEHPERVTKLKAEQEQKKNPVNEEGLICCPKCGSTQIQMINRKWSATTGFLTNKVDRVCMRCKHKF